jgi:hypothetical protein
MGQMLRSWKEIARHTGASVRTVQRWESELRLPVRRIEAMRRAVVFAYPFELDSWLRARSETQCPYVEDSYFRTVFMDSQFPSLVVDNVPRILAANFAVYDLMGEGAEQLLGAKLQRLLPAGKGPAAADNWANFVRWPACRGQANLQLADGSVLGVELVTRRFPPGLHVVSILSAGKQWPATQVWCRPMEPDFSFRIQSDSSPNSRRGQRNAAPIDAS